MADDFDQLGDWADRVLDEEARLSEHLTDSERWDRAVMEGADEFMLADGLLADPNDPEAQEAVLGESGTRFTQAVAVKVAELLAARHHAA
jgi:hypothetical protein